MSDASPSFLGAPIPGEGDDWSISIDYIPVDPWKGTVPLGTLFYLDNTYLTHFFLYYRAFLPGACLQHTMSGAPGQVKRLSEKQTPLMYLGTYELRVAEHFGNKTHPVKDLIWGIRFLVGEEELWEVYWPFQGEDKFPEGFVQLTSEHAALIETTDHHGKS